MEKTKNFLNNQNYVYKKEKQIIKNSILFYILNLVKFFIATIYISDSILNLSLWQNSLLFEHTFIAIIIFIFFELFIYLIWITWSKYNIFILYPEKSEKLNNWYYEIIKK
jgi:positive regulator of sigma E activity